MQKTKIEWTDAVWNPVWGCLNQGECRKFCYARKIARRFSKKIAEKEVDYRYRDHKNHKIKYPQYYIHFMRNMERIIYDFLPVFMRSNFDKPFNKKPCKIFVGSMSEIFYWKELWMKIVLEKIKKYPQHIFQFLTKFPEVYERYDFPDNCWLGITIINRQEFRKIDHFFGVVRKKNNIKYISIEPIHSHIKENILGGFDWIIVGAETGNRKDKLIPKKEWIDYIVNYCKEYNIPIFLKDNLKNIYSDLIQEFPK